MCISRIQVCHDKVSRLIQYLVIQYIRSLMKKIHMKILINAEKHFTELTLIMTKMLRRIEDNLFNFIKYIDKICIANITLKGESLNASPLILETRKRCLFSLFIFNICCKV